MTRRSGAVGTRRLAPDAASPGSSLDKPSKMPSLPRPADLARPRRLSDDERLGRVMKTAREDACRRRIDLLDGSRGRMSAGERTRVWEAGTDDGRYIRPLRRHDAGTGTADPGCL